MRAATDVEHLNEEQGVALVIALVTMVALSALGMALSLMTMTEGRVAAAYRNGLEALYAVDAVIELATRDVAAQPDVNAVLSGPATASFVDGPPGARTLPDGTTIDLAQLTNLVSCGKTACSDADLDAESDERPWGRNNPRWRLYAYGPLATLSSRGAGAFRDYVIVWVADDPSDNDGQPLVDGEESAGTNPGRGRLSILAHGYGPAGSRRVIETTIAKSGARVRILSWRETHETDR